MIYHIFANKSNIGDWLSARGIQSALVGHAITELFCDTPFVSETMTRLRALQPEDFVIIGGGGLFMDYFVPFWSAFSEIAEAVPFGIWGVGFCDLKREASLPPSEIIEAVIRRSRFCYARDELTRTHLAGLNLPQPTGCPSLLDLMAAPGTGRGLLHVDNYDTVGSEVYDFMDALGRRMAAASNRPFRRTNNRIDAGDESQLQKCLQLYHDSDIVLSSGLHGCVIGAALGKKVVAVSGDLKIDYFMRSVALGDWVCERDDLGRVELLLATCEKQEATGDFVARLRQANEDIGRRVQTMLASSDSIATSQRATIEGAQ